MIGACEGRGEPARGRAGVRGAGEPDSRGASRALRGKRALFGDPALVPTRAGERARAELALADAARATLEALGARELAVEVRLPGAADPGAVVVAGRAPPGHEEAEIRRLVADLCGPWSEPVIRVAWQAEAAGARVGGAEASPPSEAPGGSRWPLYWALIGLGASAGVTLDRLRRRLGGLGYTWPR